MKLSDSADLSDSSDKKSSNKLKRRAKDKRKTFAETNDKSKDSGKSS